MAALQGKVAIVTGGSRGAGAGVARALGSAGATVYVTGRTQRGGARPADGAVGTVEDTAEEVTRRGGRGVAVACDHTDDRQVAALFEQVEREQGRLDLLVNTAWGGNEVPGMLSNWSAPCWEVDAAAYWESMFTAGVRSALMASTHAARAMAKQRSGLIINVSFVTAADGGGAPDKYLGNLYYDLSKAALNRLAVGLAADLAPCGVAALALSPGHMRTERVLQAYEATEAGWQGVPELVSSETPEYLGRAVAALAADGDVLRYSGQALLVAELARRYGFTDVDGSQPPPFTM